MSSSNSIDFNWSTFNPLEQQKKSRLVAGLLLTMVVVVHMALAMYLLNGPQTEHKKPLVVMEVALLLTPEPIAKPEMKEPPPAPPVKKQAIKPQPVVKPPEPIKKPKPVVVKKPAPTPKPKPAEAKEEVIPVPKFEPAPAFVPPPPIVAPAPPAAPSASSNSRVAAKPVEAAGRGSDSNKSVVSGVVPLVRVAPKYPARAAGRHIEGWVKVEFTIQTDGSVDDVVVVGSEPENIFDDAALTAIKKWKFKEKMVNGVAVPQRAAQRLQFKLKQ